MTLPWTHTSVMLSEALEALAIHKDDTYIDATFGRGGHAREILKNLSNLGRLIAFDRDPDAVKVAQEINDDRLKIHHSGFSAICELPPNTAAGVLLDLGVSSPQIDNPAMCLSHCSRSSFPRRYMDSSIAEFRKTAECTPRWRSSPGGSRLARWKFLASRTTLSRS